MRTRWQLPRTPCKPEAAWLPASRGILARPQPSSLASEVTSGFGPSGSRVLEALGTSSAVQVGITVAEGREGRPDRADFVDHGLDSDLRETRLS